MSSTVDIYALYKIITALVEPFEETEAFKLGLIDEKGKKLRKARTREEKKAYGYFERFVFNIKRILQKVGLGSKFATFASAMFLLREYEARRMGVEDLTEDQIITGIHAQMKELKEDQKTYKELTEEIANATGAAVAGTGDTGVTWVKHPYRVGEKGDRKRKGRYINGVAYLKKVAREANKK